jgi:hypothetical protein
LPKTPKFESIATTANHYVTPSETPASARKPFRPRWWQVLLIVVPLTVAAYRSKPYWHYIATEGVVTEVKTTTSRNRTIEGCVVAYRYQVQYTDNQNQTHFAEHEHSTESRTCRTDEINSGDKETVYYNSEKPEQSVQYTSDSIGAGLYLFSIFGVFNLLVQWIIVWWRSRKRVVS